MAVQDSDPSPNRRLIEQMELIREAIPELGVDPPDWFENPDQPLGCIFAQGYLLVRDEYIEGTAGLLRAEVHRGLTRGVTALRLPEGVSTLDALREVERAFGTRVAAPDHFVGITPPTRCPATEPAVVRSKTPVPPVSSHDTCRGAGVRVAVIDTGLLDDAETAHAWLAGVTGDSEGPMARPEIGPYVGHGTFIAGVIRAMAPDADVWVGLTRDTRVGEWRESDMVEKLDEAVRWGADVISLSAGTNTYGDAGMLALDAWYEATLRDHPEIVVVASAGNNGDDRRFYPAAWPWTLSVGATDPAGGARADFSNFGAWVQLSAPGVDFVNAYATGRYRCSESPGRGRVRNFRNGVARWSGTSFATPLVAGMIAARASGRGVDVVTARDELVAMARANAVAGVGPVLMPEMTCAGMDGTCPCCGRPIGEETVEVVAPDEAASAERASTTAKARKSAKVGKSAKSGKSAKAGKSGKGKTSRKA